MKAASQHLTSLFRKSVRIRHDIMRHSSFPRTSPLHYYYITAESRCPCRKSRPKRRSAHHNFKRDTLHLNLHQCLCFRWMSGSCDSISLESIWTWSIMVRKYTISGSSSIFCFLHFSNYFWFNFLQKNTNWIKFFFPKSKKREAENPKKIQKQTRLLLLNEHRIHVSVIQ